MTQTLLQKLRIKAGDRIAVLNPPDGDRLTGGIPPSVTVSGKLRGTFKQVHCFVRSKAELDRIAPAIIRSLEPAGLVWIYFPKKASRLQTDLSRDFGWDVLRQAKFTQVSLIGLDETWSAFAFRRQTVGAEPKSEPASADFSRYIDRRARRVQLPPDMKMALKKDKKATSEFEALSFTHKREYIEWVLQAKQEETRSRRITTMIGQLKK